MNLSKALLGFIPIIYLPNTFLDSLPSLVFLNSCVDKSVQLSNCKQSKQKVEDRFSFNIEVQIYFASETGVWPCGSNTNYSQIQVVGVGRTVHILLHRLIHLHVSSLCQVLDLISIFLPNLYLFREALGFCFSKKLSRP